LKSKELLKESYLGYAKKKQESTSLNKAE